MTKLFLFSNKVKDIKRHERGNGIHNFISKEKEWLQRSSNKAHLKPKKKSSATEYFGKQETQAGQLSLISKQKDNNNIIKLTRRQKCFDEKWLYERSGNL